MKHEHSKIKFIIIMVSSILLLESFHCSSGQTGDSQSFWRLSDVSGRYKIFENTALDPLKNSPVQKDAVGIPKYDDFFTRCKKFTITMRFAMQVVESYRKKMAGPESADVKAKSIIPEIGASLLLLLELPALAQEAEKLKEGAQDISAGVKTDFTGWNARKAPGVIDSLSDIAQELNRIIPQVASLTSGLQQISAGSSSGTTGGATAAADRQAAGGQSNGTTSAAGSDRIDEQKKNESSGSSASGSADPSSPITRSADSSESTKIGETNSSQIPVPLRPPSFAAGDPGTVRDSANRLVWQKCAPGQSPTGCTGRPSRMLLLAAKKYCEGLPGGRWRVPTIEEMKSLVDPSKPESAPKINGEMFPLTMMEIYWSSSSYNNSSATMLVLDFAAGIDFPYGTVNRAFVRCVMEDR